MEPLTLTAIASILGYISGNFHSHCAHSSCLYGLFEVDGAELNETVAPVPPPPVIAVKMRAKPPLPGIKNDALSV